MQQNKIEKAGILNNSRALAVGLAVLALLDLTSCHRDGLLTGKPLELASNGRTGYAIVRPAEPTDVDGYAINILTNCLYQKTGVMFPVVKPDNLPQSGKFIFVGLSAPALKRTGKAPLASMADQDHAARSTGADIVLYGKGVHGNLYAVLDFMENSLGWRWFSRFDKPLCVGARELNIKPFSRIESVSFPYRRSFYNATEFCYQHGMNVGFSSISALYKAQSGKDRFPPGVVSALPKKDFIGVHSLHQYIPPLPSSHIWEEYRWIGKSNYFETNPEFFTMDSAGKRVPNRQLCFSCPGLRQELTKNILAHARRQGPDAPIALGAEDGAQPFCECPDCRALEKKYNSPGGPLYDYLLELAPIMRQECPSNVIKVLSYRRVQTQKPPALAPGMKLPDNVYVVFAHIDDAINYDWNHPTNRSTCEDLAAWGRITKSLWTWSYPLPSGKGVYLPFSNTRRLVQTMRAMKKAGVEGVYQEYYADRVMRGYGFSDLHIYLYYKLARDVDADEKAIIREFTDYQYGPAAELVRVYLEELETAVAASATPIQQCPVSYDDFPYLTAENIHRWQKMFDQMEENIAADSRCLANLRRLRREVDFATLLKWFDLVKAHPDYFKDYKVHAERVTAAGKTGETELNDLLTVIKGGGKVKPLPPDFNGIPLEKIRQYVPENKGQGKNASKQRTILDPDAAFGYAATVFRQLDRDLPFAFGFFQNRIGATEAPWGTPGPQRELKLEDITPGVYRVYKLGIIEVTPSCRIWLQVNQGWATVLDLGERLLNTTDPSAAANRWEAFVSLKFDGPAYGGAASENIVLCDRVVLVKK